MPVFFRMSKCFTCMVVRIPSSEIFTVVAEDNYEGILQQPPILHLAQEAAKIMVHIMGFAFIGIGPLFGKPLWWFIGPMGVKEMQEQEKVLVAVLFKPLQGSVHH